MAFDGAAPQPQEPPNHTQSSLSQHEKAMLFDAAVTAVARLGRQASQEAHLIVAFAQAYVLIRDREEGIV